jgi:hypothetical protein
LNLRQLGQLTELLKIAPKNNRQQGNLLRLQAQFNFRNIILNKKTSETLNEDVFFISTEIEYEFNAIFYFKKA